MFLMRFLDAGAAANEVILGEAVGLHADHVERFPMVNSLFGALDVVCGVSLSLLALHQNYNSNDSFQ
jgi:hypothetical protein